ncbi:hypothetical protein [Tessaracoccus flavescens]|uniref:Uncharacterized protein n=1 Tax=Tessaracoccus flavescens TaxID=399497 RepID=A0A1Q2CYB9_9ACTN|nr:hypothetical protein [Tessaracoccus flavescens]AQP51119.1 hypothetical protein BW733_10060 [Tessaracoccus flavescens]
MAQLTLCTRHRFADDRSGHQPTLAREGRRRNDGADAGPNQGPSLVQFTLCIRHRFAGAGRLDA